MHKKNIYKLKTIFCCLLLIVLIPIICLSCKNGTDVTNGTNGIDGKDGKDGISIVWLGSYTSANEIENPQLMNAYYNTTDGCSYIYDGTKWTILAKNGATGVNGSSGTSIVWLGSYASAEEIENPEPMNAYYNTTDGSSYINDGKKWTLLAKGIPEIKESEKILLNLSLPNDNENCIKLTKDSAPIKVSIPSSFQISKAVWKKGDNNTVVNPSDLIDDTESNPITLDFNNTGSFYVSENGWYDVVAQDSLGRMEWNHVEVKTIDKTSLGEVKQLTASTKDRFATVNWKDVTSKEKYDSPIKNIKITYIYNDDENDTNNGELLVEPGVETAKITIPRIKTADDFIRITVQTVDEVGNISAGTKVQVWCTNQIYATKDDIEEKVNSMTTSGEIAVVGECSIKRLLSVLTRLYKTKPNIKIDLDLSEVVGWKEFIDVTDDPDCGYAFNVTSLILPEGVTELKRDCMYQWTNLKRIEIPYGVTRIESHAISETGLETINIPDSVTYIGDNAFDGNRELSEINLSKNITYIGTEAFDLCFKLSTITIPESVTLICPYLFGRNAREKNINFEDTTTNWYKSEYSNLAEATLIGPMTEDNAKEIVNSGYYYFSEKHQIE